MSRLLRNPRLWLVWDACCTVAYVAWVVAR